MSHVLALITQDAALVRCELDRVRQGLPPEPGSVVGVGGWQDGQVVQRRYGAGVPLAEAWEAPDSEVVMLASRVLGVGQNMEHSAQPFRFRQWLFAAAGTLERAEAVRERLWEELPEFLQGTVRGPTWEEAAFARFLAELREIGRMEDPQLDAITAASRLGACARAIDQVSGGVGVTGRPGFALVASNGRLVVATRRGGQALSYALLEGTAECARHELTAQARDGESLVRDHRRRRSVVVASINAEGWVPLPDGATLAVDRRLTATIK
jgi:glutamine amidotransferase